MAYLGMSGAGCSRLLANASFLLLTQPSHDLSYAGHKEGRISCQ